MYNEYMGYRYRESKEYIIRRQKNIFLHKLKRKDKKYVMFKDSSQKKVRIPLEIKLMGGKSKRNEDVFIQLPPVFSLTDDPSSSIATLKNVAKLFWTKKKINLKISCKNTKKFDLSALILLSSIIVKGERYLLKCGYDCTIKGDYPLEKKSRELFIYSGLPKHLNCIDPKDQNIKILEPFESIKKTSEASMQIVNYYNSCLNRNGLELNAKGKEHFYNLVNEVIDNALIHSGYHDVIYYGGYYNDIDKSIQISIINYGYSMYESLSSNNSTKYIKNELEKRTKAQVKLFNSKYTKENYWTLLALQYKVSRFSEDTKNNDRGTGTIKFIEEFRNIGNTYEDKTPKISLTSGNTSIIFDGKYELKDEMLNEKCVKIIAFNKENDLSKKPDDEYVKNISNHFPGVVINLDFFIDKNYLQNTKEGKNDKN